MRKDITFDSTGLTCRGWLYTPDDIDSNQKVPTIIMAHGFSAVKEQALPGYAERFAEAGFGTLLFDYRFFGSSDGEPRCQLFPLEMLEDYRNAITWVCKQTNVDADRIGVWGTSFSGGLATYTGTFDKRVKALVAQVPSLTNAESRRSADPVKWDSVGDFLLKDRITRYRTAAVNYMKVVAPEGEPFILPGAESYDAFMELASAAPNWRNEVTLESLEKVREFDPVSLIHLMAPAALLVIAAEQDSLISLDVVMAAYERAINPKELIIHPIKHFDIYKDPWLTAAAKDAIAWFKQHLVQS
ncbi:MAG: alpha/beta hydrolase [Deltaproteobacteria bacterium]|jgi:fermentation-respiration switch protein FrsA (DUF1100 family)|nr:alpha/beta hydrolase [Deltaproteobacteria bacterium]